MAELIVPDLDHLEGWLWPDEGELLFELAVGVPADQAVVEIGSNRGKSSAYLAAGSRAGNGALVHCVDLWDLGGQSKRARRDGCHLPETFDRFREQTAPWADLIVEHKGASVDVAAAWSGQAIGLLFIDGTHSYEACSADIAAWTPYVPAGGWVAFHDYTPGVDVPDRDRFPGVQQAVDEFCADVVRPSIRSGRLLAVQL